MKKIIISIFIFALFLNSLMYSGCSSSSEEQERSKKMIELRKNLDSLKKVYSESGKTLDSLNRVMQMKNEELKRIQAERDSLIKNIESEKNK